MIHALCIALGRRGLKVRDNIIAAFILEGEKGGPIISVKHTRFCMTDMDSMYSDNE